MFGRTILSLSLVVGLTSLSHAQQLDPRRSYSPYRSKSRVMRGYSPARRVTVTNYRSTQRPRRPTRIVEVNRSYRDELSRARVFHNPYERPVAVRRTQVVVQRPLATTRPTLPQGRNCRPATPTYRPAIVAPPRYSQYRPVVTLTRMPSKYYVGRGIIGQPKVYVPGQPIRNFFRYLSP